VLLLEFVSLVKDRFVRVVDDVLDSSCCWLLSRLVRDRRSGVWDVTPSIRLLEFCNILPTPSRLLSRAMDEASSISSGNLKNSSLGGKSSSRDLRC